ncbi:glycosyltransferase family A protein [Candidatus Nitrospira bockiana]
MSATVLKPLAAARPGLVTTVIPCFNHARYLPEAIESVLSQTYANRQVIVVDDGSSDETADVAARYADVEYVRQENQGLPGARNTGLRHSRGEYVVFLDADDRLLPGHFEASLSAFRRHPDAAFVCGSFRYFGAETGRRSYHYCEPTPDHYATFLRFNFIGAIHSVMFKRKALLAAGGFSPELRASEDYDLYLRLVSRYPMHCHHQLVAEYRQYAQQMSGRPDLMLETTMSVLRRQRAHIKNRPAYLEAYRDGVRRMRADYGERAAWQLATLVRAGQWQRAAQSLRVLLRWYPSSLPMLLKHKLARLYSGSRPGHPAARAAAPSGGVERRSR